MQKERQSESRPVFVSNAKELRKKLRNRQSAQRARDRQKARMRWLEREVAIITRKNQDLQNENNALRNLLAGDLCDTQLRSEVRTHHCDAKSRRPEADCIMQGEPQRNNSVGSMQRKLGIVGCEHEKCGNNVYSVSVISPVSTREVDALVSNPTPTLMPKNSIGAVQRPGDSNRNKTVESNSASPDDSKVYNYKGNKNYDQFFEKYLMNLPFALQVLRATYPQSFLPHLYPTAYAQHMPLMNWSPTSVEVKLGIQHANTDAKEPRDEKVVKKINNMGCDLSQTPRDALAGLYTRRWPGVSLEIPVLNDAPARTTTLGIGRMLAGGNPDRHRRNTSSYESECSSQFSSETELHSQSP